MTSGNLESGSTNNLSGIPYKHKQETGFNITPCALVCLDLVSHKRFQHDLEIGIVTVTYIVYMLVT